MPLNGIPYEAISARIDLATDDERVQQSEILAEAEHFLSERGASVCLVAGIGDPANEILRVAEQTDADMIAVGRPHGHKPHLLGPLSAKLVRAATSDVLLVHLAPETPGVQPPPLATLNARLIGFACAPRSKAAPCRPR